MKTSADLASGCCAVLFLVAALGKFDSWTAWSTLTTDLPGPPVLQRAVRWTVPLAELAVSGISFVKPPAGLAAAAALLALFAAGVWFLAGRLPGHECNCFGAIAPSRLSSGLAFRNAVLAAAAASGSYLTQEARLQRLSGSSALVALVTAVIAVMVTQYRRVRRAGLIHQPESTVKEMP